MSGDYDGDEISSAEWNEAERDDLESKHDFAPAPAMALEDEALVEIKRVLNETNCSDSQFLEIMRQIAELRSCQSPPEATLGLTPIEIQAMIDAFEFIDPATIPGITIHTRANLGRFAKPSAAPQPSPQGEDADIANLVGFFELAEHRIQPMEAVKSAKASFSALRARLDASEAEIQHRIALAIEEHEGALCPEDMGCAEYIASLKTALASAREMREWISVEDRQPEIGQTVIAYRPTAHLHNDDPITNCVYTGTITHSFEGIKHRFSRINHPSHWMPLPEPPKDRAALERNTKEQGK